MNRHEINRKYLLPGLTGINKYFFMIILLLSPSIFLLAQVPGIPSSTIEQQLEGATEENADNATEDDSFLQNIIQFLKDPVNLNVADAAVLKELVILSTIQIENLISYRNIFGNFINIYELQAIPGWDIRTIQRLRPYVTVSANVIIVNSINDRLRGGTNTIWLGTGQVLEPSKGYKLTPDMADNYYPGSPQRFFLRYKYQYKNLLQFGIVAEKDAGEQFFRGAQKQGFDYYSAHLFARNIGIIKLLAIGDFTINMGQGLTQWQNLAFKKGAEVINVKRQLSILRPYNSAGEINFHRGMGITLGKNNLETTLFVSYKKVDGNFVKDSLYNDYYISSLQTSGLHRTKSEIEDKGAQQQFAYGGNFAFNKSRLHIGINVIQFHFNHTIHKEANPYSVFALSGKNFGNYSFDYSYTFKNLHFFGEAATTNNFNKAFVNGLIISVDSKVDMSLLYRNISKKYQSIYTNAFTENTTPSNEKGIFAGISIRPDDFWRINAYADFYKFPWLKYLVDAPSVGSDYLLTVAYKPNRQLEMYVLYRTEKKLKDYNPDLRALSPVVNKPRQNLRTQVIYMFNPQITFRNRVEMVWFDKNGAGAQNGFLSFVDFIYQPMQKRYSGNIRLQYFETDGYDSRLYAYENDVLYNYSIPVFYDKGFRYYLNFNYQFNKKLSAWFRWAKSIYKDKKMVGSGLDEIQGNKKTEINLLVQYQF